MSDQRAIGVLDSGLGGLTVVRELHRLMPHERLEYLGDTARYPYGGRLDETIKTFGMQDARFLVSKDIKMLIIACNTISSVALESIREQSKEIPVIGVILPACKAAVTRTAEKRIGVIGTAATIRSGAYTKGIQNLDAGLKVFGKECPLFVPIVEEGLQSTDIARVVSQYYLYELVDSGIDCLILGCTHYPLLMEVIQDTVSTRIELIDSALWTAIEAQSILEALGARINGDAGGLDQSSFYVTDMTPDFERNAVRFLGNPIKNIVKIQLEQLTTYSQ